MKPWRKTREGNTGSATISLRPAASRLKTSVLDISQASNSRFFPHAVENLPRFVDDEKVEIDTFGFDLAGIERRHGHRGRRRTSPQLWACNVSRASDLGFTDAFGRWLIDDGDREAAIEPCAGRPR